MADDKFIILIEKGNDFIIFEASELKQAHSGARSFMPWENFPEWPKEGVNQLLFQNTKPRHAAMSDEENIYRDILATERAANLRLIRGLKRVIGEEKFREYCKLAMQEGSGD